MYTNIRTGKVRPTVLTHYAYQLPSGQLINVARDLCRGASYITYTLVGGRIVVATIVPGQ